MYNYTSAYELHTYNFSLTSLEGRSKCVILKFPTSANDLVSLLHARDELNTTVLYV